MKQLKIAFTSMLAFTVVFGAIYPVIMWGLGNLFFPHKAQGSLIVNTVTGRVIGSSLIGQNFKGERYFHPRPSAAGRNGYDALNSSGSNLGPTSQALSDRLKRDIANYRKRNFLAPNMKVPADAVTASGSGLDPHISLQNAYFQMARIAKARGVKIELVKNQIDTLAESPFLDIIGEKRVNVLKLNLALDLKLLDRK